MSGGGTGFIGDAIVNSLQNIGSDVRVVSRMPGANRLSWVSPQMKFLCNISG